MANMPIVNTKISALNTNQVLTLTAADVDGAGAAQKFIYTPTGKDGHICFVVYNKAAAAITATITAGAGVFGAAAKVLTIPATALTNSVFQIETGKYMQANGTIEVEFVPSGIGQLVTTHALTVGVIELQ